MVYVDTSVIVAHMATLDGTLAENAKRKGLELIVF